MGINSQGVSYNFGQMGSAYTDLAAFKIIPPKDHVIVAIQNIGDADNPVTPTLLTPEQLDSNGPNFVNIGVGTSNATFIAGGNTGNINGVVSVALTDNAGSNITTVTMSAGANTKVKKGQFVLLANDDAQMDGAPALSIDAQTPTPIYNGPNARGVKISKVDGASVTLEGHGSTSFSGISPSSQMLICIDEQHGAGGMGATGMTIASGVTIHGRWTEFACTDGDQVMCYFGK
tara:strand:+ start:285 stop:980 length:696 start_codon:yes stop_codon:yes gene_type:complete